MTVPAGPRRNEEFERCPWKGGTPSGGTWKVLVSAPYMQPVIHQYQTALEKLGDDVELVIPPVRERLSKSELLEWISDIDGVICGDDEFTEDVMKAAPKLKVISKWGTDSSGRSAPPARLSRCAPRGVA